MDRLAIRFTCILSLHERVMQYIVGHIWVNELPHIWRVVSLVMAAA